LVAEINRKALQRAIKHKPNDIPTMMSSHDGKAMSKLNIKTT